MFRNLSVSLITVTVLILVLEATITVANLENDDVDKKNSDPSALNIGEAENDKIEENAEEIASVAKILRSVFANEKPFISDPDPNNVKHAVEDVWTEPQGNTRDLLVEIPQNTQTGNSYERNVRSFTNEEKFNINGQSMQRDQLNGFADSDFADEAFSIQDGRYGYLNEWVVHLGGGPAFAKRVLDQLGYESKGQVTGFPDLYRVVRHDHPRLHKRAAPELTEQLNDHQHVVWAEQQESRVRMKRGQAPLLTEDDSDRPLVRVKRTLVDHPEDPFHGATIDNDNHLGGHIAKGKADRAVVGTKLSHFPSLSRFTSSKFDLTDKFNDKLVDNQWYLYDTRVMPSLPRLDLGVVGAWNQGMTGEGVRVTILDDGIEYTHEDLRDNYDPAISYDFNDDDDDPLPRTVPGIVNSHGTKCAGEVAMAANNGKCGVGVAFNARIGGVRMLDGHVSDRVEAESLSHARDRVDIVSCSWGPTDDGQTVEKPGRLAEQALEKGVKEGRGGKGTIFVWAAGNGGLDEDNCNCDGYASSLYTTSITSASQSNKFPWYGERCASTIASAYSSGAYSDQKITTTDINNDCTSSFSGTSAAAPLAAGIIALALETNPHLTWRDVQHLTVISSNYDTLKTNEGWYQNGLGLWVNLRFGFGLLNADRMVQQATTWETVAEQVTCSVNGTYDSGSDGSLSSQGSASLQFEVSDCSQGALKGVFLEQVQAVLSIEHSRRGALQITIISPRGTETTLLTPRKTDQSSVGFVSWPFTSVHTWGEDPHGTWTLTVLDTSPAGETGRVTSAQLQLHTAAGVPHYAQGLYKKQYAPQDRTSGARRH